MFKKLTLFIASVFLLTNLKALEVGQEMPPFKLQDETGAWRNSMEFKDKKIVIFFYPKDNSPICNSQIRNIRENFKFFEQNNIMIIGINYDSVESHAALVKKFNLPFSLLSDKTGEVANAFEADRFKLFNFVPKRRTFLIENNKIKSIIKNIDTKTHAEDILREFGIKK